MQVSPLCERRHIYICTAPVMKTFFPAITVFTTSLCSSLRPCRSSGTGTRGLAATAATKHNASFSRLKPLNLAPGNPKTCRWHLGGLSLDRVSHVSAAELLPGVVHPGTTSHLHGVDLLGHGPKALAAPWSSWASKSSLRLPKAAKGCHIPFKVLNNAQFTAGVCQQSMASLGPTLRHDDGCPSLQVSA